MFLLIYSHDQSQILQCTNEYFQLQIFTPLSLHSNTFLNLFYLHSVMFYSH